MIGVMVAVNVFLANRPTLLVNEDFYDMVEFLTPEDNKWHFIVRTQEYSVDGEGTNFGSQTAIVWAKKERGGTKTEKMFWDRRITDEQIDNLRKNGSPE